MIRRIAQGVSVLAGAALFVQFPAFYDHYVQRLGGRLDQADLQVERLETAARAEGLSLDGYVAVFLDSDVSAHRRQGRLMHEEIGERAALARAHAALTRAGALARPFVFAAHADAGVARAVWRGFAPGLPLSPEGFLYALLGAAAGGVGAAGAAKAGAALRRRGRAA